LHPGPHVKSRRSKACALTLCGLGLATFSLTARSLAQEKATIDTARGPISGSTRRVGLGGAFVAIADDSEGVAINPASSALRLPYSFSQFDYGLGVDVAIGAWLPKNDLYNQGGSEGSGKSSALFGSLAAVIYYGHFGVGVAAEAQSNAASRTDEVQGISSSLGANFGVVHGTVAYGFLQGQLLLGAGPRFIGMSFDRHGSGGPLSSAGVGYEAGFVVKPMIAQYRVAAAVKSPINATVPTTEGAPASNVHVPWEVSLGFAYQFGKRLLNPPFVTDEDIARSRLPAGKKPDQLQLQRAAQDLFEAYEKQQRWYLLVITELALAQGDGDHVGFERYWTTRGTASASRPIVSPRIGVESEVVPHILRLRAGSYYEPERVNLTPSRVHGTGGFDVRLFEWDVFGLIKPFDYWQLSVAADAARAYLNTSFSIGFWH
jgi:hypothetical protein